MLFKLKKCIDYAATPLYLLRGKRPWSAGYYTAKKKAISSAIDNKYFSSDSNLPIGFGHKIDERVVEYAWVYSKLKQFPGKVLDAGSALNHDFLLQRAPLKNADLTIMTLAPEKRCYWKGAISYVYDDLREKYFSDELFDVVVSVSTIEHIGLDNTLLYTGDTTKSETDAEGFVPAVKEYRRILKKGGVCLITVPFGKRGVYSWYQVFDRALVEKIIEAFSGTSHSIEYFGYDDNGWKKCEAEDLDEAEFFDFHENGGVAEDFAAGARGVACIRLEV
jgi:SAM-dependent methyltransferase